MPLPISLRKLVIGGSLATTETWSMSMHIAGDTIGQDILQDTGLGIQQWFARPTSRLSGLATLQWYKYNEVRTTAVGVPSDEFYRGVGSYVDANDPRTYFFPAPTVGPSWPLPPQNAFVLSLETAEVRGAAHAGRMFQPAGGTNTASTAGQLPLGADGRMSTSETMDLAVSAAQLITDINGAVDGSVCVWSNAYRTFHEVTGVRVGRVVDTQRRRRKGLIEDYQHAPIS